jgi:MoaA/NifB/PqqE/SkfB family radical SAM enzyme
MMSEGNSLKHLSAPLQLEFRIVEYCNLRCKYCYAMPFTQEMISTEDFRKIVDEAAQMHIFNICLAGGEPLLHPDFIEFLEYVISKPFSVDVLTNGTRMTRETALQIRNLVEKYGKQVNVQVSLDSIDPTVNDLVRGATEEVQRGIENLLWSGITPSIGCVVTSGNVASVASLVERYFPSITTFNIMPLMISSQVATYKDDLLAKGYWQERDQLARQLIALGKERPGISLTVLEDRDLFPDHEEVWSGRCTAGELQLIVRGNLDVITCNIAPNFVVGNLKNSTLPEIWNSMPSDFKYPCLCSNQQPE